MLEWDDAYHRPVTGYDDTKAVQNGSIRLCEVLHAFVKIKLIT